MGELKDERTLDLEHLDRVLAPYRHEERAIPVSDLPWVPITEQTRSKFLRFDFAHGQWIEIFQVDAGAQYRRHRHGGPVIGYVLTGSWRYLERDWVATPNTLIFEPPGDVHTLAAGPEGMTTLFVLEGTIDYYDDDGRECGRDDIETLAALYVEHCQANSLPIPDIWY